MLYMWDSYGYVCGLFWYFALRCIVLGTCSVLLACILGNSNVITKRARRNPASVELLARAPASRPMHPKTQGKSHHRAHLQQPGRRDKERDELHVFNATHCHRFWMHPANSHADHSILDVSSCRQQHRKLSHPDINIDGVVTRRAADLNCRNVTRKCQDLVFCKVFSCLVYHVCLSNPIAAMFLSIQFVHKVSVFTLVVHKTIAERTGTGRVYCVAF